MSLRKVCRELVLEVVFRNVAQAANEKTRGHLQLIVDEASMKVLNSFLVMSDLYAEGATSVELLEKQRQPLPELNALYIVQATDRSVDLLLADFNEQPQHQNVHLAFSCALANAQMNKLAEAKLLASRIKSLVEAPLSFVAIQGRGFHLDVPRALPALYPHQDGAMIGAIVRQLTDVCLCLQTVAPEIRHAQSGPCQEVAQQLQQCLSSCTPAWQDAQVPCQLLILDRSFDMAAALVHEYTYEAMVYDLLDGVMVDVARNTVMLEGKDAADSGKTKAREVLLSENDGLWEALKYLHIREAQEMVASKTKELTNMHQKRDHRERSTAEMLEMLRRTPEQRDVIEKLNLHSSLLVQINKELEKQQLLGSWGYVEQDIACGIDKDCRDVKLANLPILLEKLFADIDSHSQTRLRLLMLYFSCVANIPESVRDRLVESAKLAAEDHGVLRRMFSTRLMDAPVSQRSKPGNGAVHKVTKEQAKRFRKNATSGAFELPRFEPRIKDLIEQLLQKQVSCDDFPLLGGNGSSPFSGPRVAGFRSSAPPSAPSVPADEWSFDERPKNFATLSGVGIASNPLEDVSTKVRQRIIVFFIGGVLHSEFRAVAELTHTLPEGTEILLGGTAILTPKCFMNAWHHSSDCTDAPAGDV